MNALVAHAPFDALWHRIDPFTWLGEQDGEDFRTLPDRRTFRFEVDGASYFAKLHFGVGLTETLRSLGSLRLPTFDARAEVRAIERLQSVGVAVPGVVAWGARGVLPHRRRSFVVTRDVGTQRNLFETVESLPVGAHGERRAWIRAVGRSVGAMHGAGVNHRDCYLVHVLCPEAARGEAPRPVLLDLHRAQVRDTVPLRWRAKDIGGLDFSSLDLELSNTDRLRFASAYAEASGAGDLRGDPRLWRAVRARREGLTLERARRGDRFGR